MYDSAGTGKRGPTQLKSRMDGRKPLRIIH